MDDPENTRMSPRLQLLRLSIRVNLLVVLQPIEVI